MDASLKFLAGVALVMCVCINGMRGQQQTMDLVESAKSLQDLAHIAVVDALSPLQTALSLLDSQWSKLEATANQKNLNIASITVPAVDTQNVLACRARSVPKYTNLLKHLVDKENEIGNRVENATLIANALQFVSQLVANDQIQQGK
ncbi:sperm-activating peptides-like [Lytechinus variegatus]|uniref:sperm-activating peptides-like n=1 Tax=Lytechinus variegatus TaxID=7654 RepID=UPI001BB23B14|nr:sperm-activating peptides-like [Lytechinus variegatus]